MTFTSEFVDEVVRNVMRELNLPQTSGSAAPASTGSRLALTDRVITEEVLLGRVAAGGSVSIPTGAVITPSGRDYIRRHQLCVSRGASGSSGEGQQGQLLVVGEAPGVTAAAKSAGWEIVSAGGTFDAANQVARRSCQQRTVCCSAQPAVIACLVNRNSSRRAAVLSSDMCLTDLLSSMNPDTVCLSPVGWSFAELMRVFRCLADEAVAVPGEWRELS